MQQLVKINPLILPQGAVRHRLWMVYFFLTIAIIGGVGCSVVVIPLTLLGSIYEPAGELGSRALAAGIRLLLKAQPWLRAELSLESIGRGPALLVSNHSSTLDAFILLSQVPGVQILAKDVLFLIPGLGLMMWLGRHISVRRGNAASFWKAMDRIESQLAAGRVVHIFPEMTRCQVGFVCTLPFLTAPFHRAQRAGVPIIPIVIKGTDEVWSKGNWGLRAGVTVSVKSLEPLDSAAFLTPEQLCNETQRRISDALETMDH